MYGSPVITKYKQNHCVYISIERCLREAEINIGPLAARNQMRSNQVETFIRDKGPSQGVKCDGAKNR